MIPTFPPLYGCLITAIPLGLSRSGAHMDVADDRFRFSKLPVWGALAIVINSVLGQTMSYTLLSQQHATVTARAHSPAERKMRPGFTPSLEQLATIGKSRSLVSPGTRQVLPLRAPPCKIHTVYHYMR